MPIKLRAAGRISTLLALTIAILALLVSTLLALISAWQLREARRANAFPAVVDLFREYRSMEMVAARRLLSQRAKEFDESLGIAGMPDDVAQAALRVTHYLDNLGVLIAKELIGIELVAGFLGDSTLRQWQLLKGFIRSERRRRQPQAYMQYFEHLTARLVEVDPASVRAKLKKMPEEQSVGVGS